MKKSAWNDHYTRRARQERWLARSVYKLQEIDRKSNVIHKGDRVLDLGSYPGSWSQYGIQAVGPKGKVVGVDLREVRHIPSSNFLFIRDDVLTLDPVRLKARIGLLDVVLSDLSPKTTGIKDRDKAQSLLLAKRAFEIALVLLKKKGRLVCKVFEGEEVDDFKSQVRCCFRITRSIRPSAVRKGSKEVYVIGLDRI